jgi:hypothetical protein
VVPGRPYISLIRPSLCELTSNRSRGNTAQWIGSELAADFGSVFELVAQVSLVRMSAVCLSFAVLDSDRSSAHTIVSKHHTENNAINALATHSRRIDRLADSRAASQWNVSLELQLIL